MATGVATGAVLQILQKHNVSNQCFISLIPTSFQIHIIVVSEDKKVLLLKKEMNN